MIPAIFRTLSDMGEAKVHGFRRAGIEPFVLPSSGPSVCFLAVRCGACEYRLDIQVEQDRRYYAATWRPAKEPMCPRCGNTGEIT